MSERYIVCDRCGEIVMPIIEGAKFVCTCGSEAAWLFPMLEPARTHSQVIRARYEISDREALAAADQHDIQTRLK